MSTTIQINRAYHDLEKRANTLINSNENNFDNSVYNFIYVIEHIPELETMLNQYFKKEFDLRNFIVINEGSINGIFLPPDNINRVTFILQLLKQIAGGKLFMSITGMLYSIYGHKHIDDNYIDFINQVVTPCLEDLLDEIKYHIEDNLSNGNINYSNAQIQINIGELNNNGNFNIGNNNKMSLR